MDGTGQHRPARAPCATRGNTLTFVHSAPQRTMNGTICYEQPLNERIRTLLRLEFLFTLADHRARGESHWDSRAAVTALLDIVDLLSRTDIKSELGKELERQLGVLGELRDNPVVDSELLDMNLRALEGTLSGLRDGGYSPGATLRADELITSVRQRAAIPGGTCSFDLPAFHQWLMRPAEARRLDLELWSRDLMLLRDGVTLTLDNLRRSANPVQVTASEGFYQETVDQTRPCQLIRVVLPAESPVFPEISGGKHRFTVRFLEMSGPQRQRPQQTGDDVTFQLLRCSM
ncbi:MAG: cell division protein ZapD [Gammaproteobacteria bacterium]|nr:MAG: cell division protein ZapD [Gammaproteobacteria bacterium]